MILIGEILLVVVNLLMAWWHSELIKKEKTPKHGYWGLAYVVLAGVFVYLNHSWVLAILALLIRKVVFDLSLNLFRGLPLFYVSSSTTSIIDKFHNKFFGKKSELYISIYSLAIIILNFFV